MSVSNTLLELVSALFDVMIMFIPPLLGSFIGVYFNSIREIERTNETEVFLPLINELQQVEDNAAFAPPSVLSENNSSGQVFKSVIDELPGSTIRRVDETTQNLLELYAIHIRQLNYWMDENYVLSKILDDAGYSTHIVNSLPDNLLISSDDNSFHHILSNDIPGPRIIIGHHRTPVQMSPFGNTDVIQESTIPIYALLKKAISRAEDINNHNDLRNAIKSCPGVDLEVMDDTYPGWERELWEAISSEWESQSGYEPHWMNTSGDVFELSGDDFFDLAAQSHGIAQTETQAVQDHILEQASQLNRYLSTRVEKPIYNSHRLKLALNGKSGLETINSLVGEDLY